MRLRLLAGLEGLGRVLLPPLCPLCEGEAGSGKLPFCDECAPKLPILQEPFCTTCGVPFRGVGPSHPCPHCVEEPPPFEQLRAWGAYEGPVLSLVRGFKFGGRFALRHTLEDMILEAYDRFYGRRGDVPSSVIPVPCDPATLRRRGFDVPALLSRALGRARALAWRPKALAKQLEIPELVGLTAAERSRAVSRAYAPREELRGSVLLVDDVVTTTATARACAHACIQAGADSVSVLALARTPQQSR